MSSERDLKAEAFVKANYGHKDYGPIEDFKEGWDQALQSKEVNKLREDNRIMRKALEFYVKHSEIPLDGIIQSYETGGTVWNCFHEYTKKAREALEKVK